VTQRVTLARRTPVADCQGLLAIEALLVPSSCDLLDAMRRSARQPSTRLIGVVDGEGLIVGVLPVSALAEAVVAHAVPEAFFAGLPSVDDVAHFGHTMEARTVAELMLPPATVAPDATIAEAFRLMHQRQLSGLYVIDARGRSIGYLDLQELAMRYVGALETSDGAAGAPSPRPVELPPTTEE
jgi:CBS domain-containing protein